MALTEPPICEFGQSAPDFSLLDATGKIRSLAQCQGENGTLVMFICNHCPYVQGIIERLVEDTLALLEMGVNSVAIMPNDTVAYPEDSLPNMHYLSERWNFPFPYLLDETQEVARAYGAVCTPDFFGYNAALQLQYRGRLDAYGKNPAPAESERILVEAMRGIAKTGSGPEKQTPSMGCSIKWR
ncbi:MAG: thioredoxin family protein [Candidatus Eutrophobiaceae bacterium]